MPLETATYISDLNASNPAASDQLAQADDHMRLLKATIKTTFPNINGAVTATPAQINNRDVGAILAFPKAPSGLLSGGTSGAGVYLECDGSLYLIADHPDLAAFLGTTFGGNGTTTFGVPNLKDTGRFLRSRTNSVAVGTSQANQNKSHTHTGGGTTSGASADHTHTYSGTTSGQSNSHTHQTPTNTLTSGGVGGTPGGTGLLGTAAAGDTTSAASADHSHTYSGTTSGSSADHTHTFSFTTSTGSADGTEARPEAFVVIYAIKR